MAMTSTMPVSEFELVLRRVAQGARLLAMAWWVVLGIVTLVGGSTGDPQWVLVAIALAVIWAVATSMVYRSDPILATARPLIAGDLALAVFGVTIALTLAEAGNFYGGMPILMVVIAAVRSARSAWITAIVLAVVTGGDLLEADDLVVPVAQILVYLAGAFIANWAIGTLRSSDEQIRAATESLARSRERTQIFEHLHDSVLQTLALIQRAADRPTDVVSLARRQERELRDWLYGSASESRGGLGDEIRRVAADVEERYGVPVDVVVVGEADAGDAVAALAGALREAAVNAAKHSNAQGISVYVEVADGRVTGYVRDRGDGFDPGAVGSDRRGISDSIRARMQRVGGAATLRTHPGRGTEWTLEAPL
jgi:signal transduction histidine kinase